MFSGVVAGALFCHGECSALILFICYGTFVEASSFEVLLLCFALPQSECKGKVATLSEDAHGLRVLSLLIALLSTCALLHCDAFTMPFPCHCLQLPWSCHACAMPLPRIVAMHCLLRLGRVACCPYQTLLRLRLGSQTLEGQHSGARVMMHLILQPRRRRKPSKTTSS